MNEFINKNWQRALQENQLSDFDSLWQLKTPWFEEPNYRRGGWSGVTKINLKSEKKTPSLFVKRQENHISRTWAHPVKGIATFEKEYKSIQLFNKYNIPTLSLIYFSSRQHDGNSQAILITEELTGYQPIGELFAYSQTDSHLPFLLRRRLIADLASLTKKMHLHHFQHNCFYPKHIFVKQENGNWSIKFIDLEKVKRTITTEISTLRDLTSLVVHSSFSNKREQLYFFKCYQNEKKLTKASRKLLSKINKKINEKMDRSEKKRLKKHLK